MSIDSIRKVSLSTITFLMAMTTAVHAQVPQPFCLRGHVFDSLGVPHEGAEVFGYDATFTAEDGSWEMCHEIPVNSSYTAWKSVNGRPALQARISDYLITAPDAYYDFYLPYVMEPQVCCPDTSTPHKTSPSMSAFSPTRHPRQ